MLGFSALKRNACIAAQEGGEPVSDFIVECSYDRKKEIPFVFILHLVRYGDEKFRFLSILDFCIASYDEENPRLLSLWMTGCFFCMREWLCGCIVAFKHAMGDKGSLRCDEYDLYISVWMISALSRRDELRVLKISLHFQEKGKLYILFGRRFFFCSSERGSLRFQPRLGCKRELRDLCRVNGAFSCARRRNAIWTEASPMRGKEVIFTLDRIIDLVRAIPFSPSNLVKYPCVPWYSYINYDAYVVCYLGLRTGSSSLMAAIIIVYPLFVLFYFDLLDC